MSATHAHSVRLLIMTTKPTWKFAFSHPAHLPALGFGSGLAAFSPGTFGTLFGWLVFTWIDPFLSDTAWLLVLVTSFLVGIWFCDVTGKALGIIDHGGIVWDEIVAIWLILWICADSLGSPLGQLACVIVFRFFDIVKPPPIKWFDTKFKSGFGVMLDDIVAACLSLLTIAVAVYFFGVPDILR